MKKLKIKKERKRKMVTEKGLKLQKAAEWINIVDYLFYSFLKSHLRVETKILILYDMVHNAHRVNNELFKMQESKG